MNLESLKTTGKKIYTRTFISQLVFPSMTEVAQVEMLVADVANAINCSRTEAIGEIFTWGLEHVTNQIEDIDKRQEYQKLLFNRRLIAVIRTLKAQSTEIAEAMQKFGPDTIREAALAAGLDLDKVESALDTHAPTEGKPWTNLIAEWLDAVLQPNTLTSIHDIKKKAIEDEVLPPESTIEFVNKWQCMRQIASQMGYSRTGARGYWQKVMQ